MLIVLLIFFARTQAPTSSTPTQPPINATFASSFATVVRKTPLTPTSTAPAFTTSIPPTGTPVATATAILPTSTSQAAAHCPSYDQSQEPRPAVVHYPNAQDTQVQEMENWTFDDPNKPEFTSAGAAITKITTFTTTDDTALVNDFYYDKQIAVGWSGGRLGDGMNLLYFSWILDTRPWTNPPCNATPITGIPTYLLKIEINPSGTGSTVRIVEGVVPGL